MKVMVLIEQARIETHPLRMEDVPEPRADAEGLLEAAREIPIHTHVQTFPLDRANEALIVLKERRFGVWSMGRISKGPYPKIGYGP